MGFGLVQIVAIDMSAEFRAALRDVLPTAQIAADHWHVMTRTDHMVTQVRRRHSWDLHARHGRIVDPAWKYQVTGSVTARTAGSTR